MEDVKDKNIDDFQKDIKHYIKVHKELHGSAFKWEDVHKDFMGSFPESDAMEVMDEIERQEKQTAKGLVLDFGLNQEEHF